MASAGRILIMPKGEYDAETTYEMLDLVTYNGTSWISKKTSIGIDPSAANSEYWQSMFDFDPSTKADGGSVQITKNPEGLDYIVHTFYLTNANTVKLFANVVGTDSLFVTGISITEYQSDYVTAKFQLSQAVNYDVTLAVGFLY